MASAIECTEQDFPTYAEWCRQQSCFVRYDSDGTDRDHWLCVPFTYCPNVAEIVDESNQAALTKMLEQADPTGETYELQRFGHWATPYERYIVEPGSAAHKAAAEAICALSEHSILDESDFSERECEAQYQSVLEEIRRLTFERDDKPLTDDQENDLASEICQHANTNETYDRDDLTRALEKLGWVCCIDDTWRPESETESLEQIEPDACITGRRTE